MFTRQVIGWSAALCGLLATVGWTAGDEQEVVKPPYGARPGQKLPLLVLDFTTGAHKGHCGCVSVMIRNTKARGIVITSRGLDQQALALAGSVDELLPEGKGKAVQGYLAVFSADQQAWKESQDKLNFKNLNLGHPRDSAKKWFPWVGLKKDTACAVFFINQDKIETTWEFPPEALTEAKRAEIMATAKDFAGKR